MIVDSKPKSKIRRFFAGLNRLITSFRLLVFNLLFVVVIVAVAISVVNSPIESAALAKPGALVIKVEGRLVDQYSYRDPLQQLQQTARNETSTLDIIRALRRATNDPLINLVVIETDAMQASNISKIAEIGRAIKNFQRSKKPVIARGTGYGQSQYLLASYADEIWMHPMGAIELFGIGLYNSYLKEGLDKLAIKFHIFRSGNFKSYTDMFTETQMPAINKKHNLELVEDLWSTYQQIILENRPINIEQLLQYTNQPNELFATTNDFAQVAKDLQLIDSIVSRDQAHERLLTMAGSADAKLAKNQSQFSQIGFNQYLRLGKSQTSDIGLIVLSGSIHSGGREYGGISAPTVTKLLAKIREDQDLNALIVRIDSGGGSAQASEQIRRQLQLIAETDIPVYISMGSVAASGGYWIATAGQEIWADPATITGSIGVFGLLPNIEGTFNKMGIYNDGVGSAPLADAYSIDRPLNPNLGKLIQKGVDFIYHKFVGLVALARDMPIDEVKRVADGRIWTGQQAQERGLVDKLGSLQDLIKAVADAEGIEQDNWQLVAPKPTLWQMIAQEIINNLNQSDWLSSLLSIHKTDSIATQLVAQWLAVFDQSMLGDIVKFPADPKNHYLLCYSCGIDL